MPNIDLDDLDPIQQPPVGTDAVKLLCYEMIYEEIAKAAKKGLGTDGAHHKQYYLERVLHHLGYNIKKMRDRADDEGVYMGDPGIPG